MSNDLVTYDEKWSMEAKESVSNAPLSSGGRFIGHRGGVFRVGDDLEFPELCAVVLSSVTENAWFAHAFNPDNLSPPKCFALAETGAMAPHEITHQDEWFEPQADKCVGCVRSIWPKKGEVDPATGQLKRKECRNSRRLLLLPAGQYTKRKGSRDLDLDLFIGDDVNEAAEYIASGDVFLLKIPPTALNPYNKLVHAMQHEYNRPPHGMILRIYTEPLRNGGHTILFEPLSVLPDALYPAITARREAEKDMLLRPYLPPQDDATPF